MKFIVIAMLLASTTGQAALQPACEAAIRKNAEALLVESEVVRKEMSNEVSRAEYAAGENSALLLFALVFGPTTNAVRFETAVRNLIEEKRLTPREERVVTKVCDNNLEVTPDVFNF